LVLVLELELIFGLELDVGFIVGLVRKSVSLDPLTLEMELTLELEWDIEFVGGREIKLKSSPTSETIDILDVESLALSLEILRRGTDAEDISLTPLITQTRLTGKLRMSMLIERFNYP